MTYTPGTYSTTQQVYAFNQTINVAFGVTEFNTLNALQGFVNTVINDTLNDATTQQYMGNDWQILWGPIVFSNNPGANSVIADNTMALFYSPNQNMYVIAIAGTNIDSAYGWLQEDFNVTQTVTWSSVMGSGFNIPSAYSGAAISEGSNLGLQALLAMQSGSNGLIAALTNSLNALPSGSKAQLYVTGHSLGGALSPVMALYLHDLQQQSNNWNANGCITTIHAMPSAGPTPGEANFAAYYSYLCGQTPAANQAGISYTSVYNTLDVVPHAWQKEDIAQIPTIYEGSGQIQPPLLANPKETIMGSLSVGLFLRGCNTSYTFLGKKIPKNTYTQVSASPAVRSSFTGVFNTTVDTTITSKTTGLSLILPSGLGDYATYFVNFVRFLAQAGWQHTVAYSGSKDATTNVVTNGFLQVVEVVVVEQGYKTKLLPSKQTEEQLHEAALSRVVGIDLQNLDENGISEEAAQAEA